MKDYSRRFTIVGIFTFFFVLMFFTGSFFVHAQDLENPDPGGSNCNTNPNSDQCSAGGADYPYDDSWPYGTLPKPADPGLAWYKLKNASFNKSTLNHLNNLPLVFVPYKGNPAKYDDTNDDADWRKLRFSSGEGAGVVTFEGKGSPETGGVNIGYIGIGSNCVNVGDFGQADRCMSVNNWRTFQYTPQKNMNVDRFLEYSQTRKNHVITTVDKLQKGVINILQTPVEITSGATNPNINQGGTDIRANILNETELLSKAPLVLIVKGNVSINLPDSIYDSHYRHNVGKFNSGNAAIAIMSTKNISFSTNISEANGIFISDSVNTGFNDNLGLKVKGNIITRDFTMQRQQTDHNNRYASLFIIFDPSPYIELLPYLSLTSYDWKTQQ